MSIHLRAAGRLVDYAISVSSEPPKTLRAWLVIGSLTLLALGLLVPAAWVESVYCRGLFPWIQNGLVSLTGLVAWPLTFSVLVSLPIVWPVLAFVRWRRGRRQGVARLSLLWAGWLRFARVLLYTAAVFLLCWGYGYGRVPVEDRWQLNERELKYAEVRDVGRRLLSILHRDAPKSGEVLDQDRAWAAIAKAEQELVAELEGWSPAIPAFIKFPPPGALMFFGINGVCYPFTLEANVDPALPSPLRLAISGHELAHVFGYCGEADANLVSFVAGLRAKDAFARYSTALQMTRYAMAGPSRPDNLWLYANLPKRALQDLEDLRRSRRRYTSSSAANIASRINDAYLKTQGVALGTEDYERGFRLFVQAFLKGMVAMPSAYEPDANAVAEPAQKAATSNHK